MIETSKATSILDVNSIVDAIVKAVNVKLSTTSPNEDNYDNSETLKKMAETMTRSSEKESNLGSIKNISEDKKDNTETDKTIDLLSGLGD